ncbi:peptidylprolyl isomerase [Naasia lichenicola]|uniref:peptidylprolyl isomerase n=1 Tax=Naasia lichenicola TaxID=2565933 RepID=A0A4S4FTW6_9MICO|nr:peptidylprolyl isomerase [Naasia lichenicola]THG33036.1 peptidylprolyl isomerase [Naasia lichenicola]
MAGKQDRSDRVARARLRSFTAKQTVHAEQVARRRRDNIVAIVAGVIVIALAATAQVFYFTAGPGVPIPTPTPSASASAAAEGANVGDVPSADLSEYREWTGEMTLNDIPLGITLEGGLAPQGVASFVSLAQTGFYDAKTCHRLTDTGFSVLQCGSVDGAGGGDLGYSFGPIENAPADDVYPAGTIALARQSDNAYSNGSQFFIVYADTTITSDTAGGYTVIGQVTSGLDQLIAAVTDAGTVDGSSDGAPLVPTTITSVTVQ